MSDQGTGRAVRSHRNGRDGGTYPALPLNRSTLGKSTPLSRSPVRSENDAVMTWHVQYRDGAEERVARHPSPERAIEAACRLIDAGCNVYGIGTGPLTDSIGRAEIARIYEIWARAAYPSRRYSDFVGRSP